MYTANSYQLTHITHTHLFHPLELRKGRSSSPCAWPHRASRAWRRAPASRYIVAFDFFRDGPLVAAQWRRKHIMTGPARRRTRNYVWIIAESELLQPALNEIHKFCFQHWSRGRGTCWTRGIRHERNLVHRRQKSKLKSRNPEIHCEIQKSILKSRNPL